MATYLGLLLFGALVGVFGTMIGAGGGFIIAPILLLLYPHESADTITSISLAVTFANAASGSLAYARMRRIDFRYGLIFAAAAVPGSILGAVSTYYVSRWFFDLVFAIILLAMSALVFVKAPASNREVPLDRVQLDRRKLTIGIAISIGVGFISSFLGIGGGIIHVPALAGILGFPIHMATATSHFILAITALIGTIVHIATGTFHHGVRRALVLAIGVMVGAQIGARASQRVQGRVIIRALAVALAIISVRLLFQVFTTHSLS